MVAPTLTGQQTAQLLVQKVSRAFYNPRQSIVLDNLIQKPVMKDTELAGRLGINTKELMKSANILLTDQIIATLGRLEMKENAQKASNQTYYFINYSHAINVIKWRMWKLQNTIDSQLRNELEAQGYVCPKCKKTFTTLDAATLYDPFENRMRCDVCGSDVEDNSTQAEAQASKDRLQRLIKQTAALRDLLKKMDDVTLPEFTEEVARKWLDENVAVGAKGPAAGPAAAQQEVRIQLQGEADEEEERRRREEEAEEKRQQNALPSWIANSTISGEASSRQLELQAKEAAAKGNYQPFASSNLNPANDAKPDPLLAAVNTEEDDLEAYYATLAAEADETATVEPSVAPTAAPSSAARSPDFSSVGTPTGASLADMDETAAALEREMNDARSTKRGRSVDTDGLSQGRDKRGRASSVDSQSLAPASVASDTGVLDDDEFEDEFEEEGDEDPNPMISVAGRMVPFLEVDEAMQQEMTPEEYEKYFDVFARIG